MKGIGTNYDPFFIIINDDIDDSKFLSVDKD